MKIHWLTYIIVICAWWLYSCAKNDVLTPKPEEKGMIPISFVGSYVDNAATRHANNLNAHLSTMGVWGWRNGMWDNNTMVFNNQAVAYNPDSAQWEYSPLQYWHKESRYTFCAYAPHQSETTATVSIDSLTRMISIKNVSLHGYNLQNIPTDSVKELFRNTPDIDWMIARRGQTATGTAGMDVEFNMQHILSKLNIRIKACEKLMERPAIAAITADSIEVSALPSKGDFVQQLTHTPIHGNQNEETIEEWTTRFPQLHIKGSNKGNITAEHTYLVESLVIPHHTSPQSVITLYYTYQYADGQTEECCYRMPLADAFSRFVSGYNHTLTFTICSKRVEFEAGAMDWIPND